MTSDQSAIAAHLTLLIQFMKSLHKHYPLQLKPPKQIAKLFLPVILSSSPLHSEPLISEFLASNGKTLIDEDGDSSDWIEITNSSPAPIDLSDFSLSDDESLPQKWSFPTGTSIAGNGRLLVFASGKNKRNPSSELHTNFSLSASSDSLLLSNENGVILSQFLNYPPQRTDISYGSHSDSSTAYFDPPTPGETNGTPLLSLVADPIFSQTRGFQTNPFTLVLSTPTTGASIHYTTDGSEPSPSNGTLYTNPISISSTTVIRAIAFEDSRVPSRISTSSYFFRSDIIEQSNMLKEITESPNYQDEALTALTALPAVSLSFPNDLVFGSTGIHSNPLERGRESERRIHFEYFDPNSPSDQIGEPAGLRIHGGNAREHPKKPFRLYFRNEYGNNRLNHPLFPESPVQSFKSLVLRGGGHDGWTFRRDWNQATFIRNLFLHDLQRAMGQPSPNGKYVNLFLNGEYWGLYVIHEFAHEHYNADHHGGDPNDWDIIKHENQIEAGDRDAWNQLIELAENGINSPNDYEAIQEFLDLENFADAMIHRIWSSDQDWLSPYFLNGDSQPSFPDDKNWYVGRKSRNGTSKFYFYSWDAEMSMGVPFRANRSTNYDFTQVSNPNSPGIIYDALRKYPDFQIFFADRLQKHFFNDGELTVSKLRQLWDQHTNRIRTPIVAESARWGTQVWRDPDRPIPFTRNGEWLPATRWVRATFLRNRSDIVLEQFRNINLFPDFDTPSFSPFSNQDNQPLSVSLSSQNSSFKIFYTTNGSDPRTDGILYQQPIEISESTILKARVQNSSGLWSALTESFYQVGEIANSENLTITEIHYHPLGPETPEEFATSIEPRDYEFLELHNTSNNIINLSNYQFTEGIAFTFPDGTTLQPGQRGTLVGNRSAFLARYGPSIENTILGEFENNTNLSNGGETLTLRNSDGEVIFDFTYNDAPPWPTTPDGTGHTLVLINPLTPSNELGIPSVWRQSIPTHGAPGREDQLSFRIWALQTYGPIVGPTTIPTVTPPGQNLSNLVHFVQGRDLNNEPLQSVAKISEGGLEYPKLTYQARTDLKEYQMRPEVSQDLINWSNSVIGLNSTVNPDGTSTFQLRGTEPISATNRFFFRIRILETP